MAKGKDKSVAENEAEPEGKIVEAAGMAGGGEKGGLWTAADLEAAMAEAVNRAQQDGVTDPAELREITIEAREKFKADRERAARRASK